MNARNTLTILPRPTNRHHATCAMESVGFPTQAVKFPAYNSDGVASGLRGRIRGTRGREVAPGTGSVLCVQESGGSRMSGSDPLRSLLMFLPAVALLVLGGIVTLRSGLVHVGPSRGFSRLAGNLSQMAVLTVLCLFALVVMQGLAGFRISLLW